MTTVHPVQANYNKCHNNKPKYDGDGYDGYDGRDGYDGDKRGNYDGKNNKNFCGGCPIKKYNPNNRLHYRGKY